ncbi:MAG: ROK family protein [Oligoflexia bacterium]|nr:ROK family protein [Oligoflexia bacterium]
MSRKTLRKVLAYDLGGTKIHVGVVNSDGQVLEAIRAPVAVAQGKKAVFEQLARLGNHFLEKHPEIRRVGVASAGPLDPKRGVLLDPTNLAKSADPKEAWGQVPLAKDLGKMLNRRVELENDAAASILAEHWLGKARGYENAMILTLGTGLGTGIIANGELVRSGRCLHPEAGHIIIRAGDRSALCGCGNYGCAEAYLSGRNFARRNAPKLGRPELTGKEITALARKRDRQALAAFDEYAEMMAAAVYSYTVIYCPEIIVFTGSFAAASPFFLPKVRKLLEPMMKRRREGIDLLPTLTVSSLRNKAGLLGGAFVALNDRNL